MIAGLTSALPDSRPRTAARRWWVTVHLYLGLIAGLGFAVLGVTGSVLVVDHALDARLNPHVVDTARPGPWQPLDRLIAAAERAAPEGVGRPHRLVMPEGEHWPVSIEYFHPSPYAFEATKILVDPVTAKVIAVRAWGDSLASFVYRLHYAFALGYAGEWLVGITGLLLIVSLGTGVYLWWPRHGSLRRALRLDLGTGAIGPWLALHKLGGMYPLLVVAIVAGTGLGLSWHRTAHHVVETVLPTRDTPELPTVTPVDGAERHSIDALVERARVRFPRAELKRVHFPQAPEESLRVMLRQPGEVARTYGETLVWVDPWRGDVLTSREPVGRPLGDAVMGWLFPLHSGQAYGVAGRAVVFIGGLVPVLLYMTGAVVWWRRRRRASSTRRTDRPPSAGVELAQ